MYPICDVDYVLDMADSWGDGWNGNEWTATGTTSGTVYGPFTIASGSSATANFTSAARTSNQILSWSNHRGDFNCSAALPLDGGSEAEAVGEAGAGLFATMDGNAIPVPPATIFVDTFDVFVETPGDGERDGGGDG